MTTCSCVGAYAPGLVGVFLEVRPSRPHALGWGVDLLDASQQQPVQSILMPAGHAAAMHAVLKCHTACTVSEPLSLSLSCFSLGMFLAASMATA